MPMEITRGETHEKTEKTSQKPTLLSMYESQISAGKVLRAEKGKKGLLDFRCRTPNTIVKSLIRDVKMVSTYARAVST